MRIDLNADLGEGVTDDDGLLEVVTSANLACGFHAGNAATMRRVCEHAAERRVVLGAQVSYADREGFGRRHMDVAPDVLTAWVGEQIATLREIAVSCGIEVAYVKPHGALYNRVVEDEEQAEAVLLGSGDLPVLGLPVSAILRVAHAHGRQTVTEGFPDRGYTCRARRLTGSSGGGDDGARRARGCRVRRTPLERSVRARLLGKDALLLECDGPGQVRAAYAEARERRERGHDFQRRRDDRTTRRRRKFGHDLSIAGRFLEFKPSADRRFAFDLAVARPAC